MFRIKTDYRNEVISLCLTLIIIYNVRPMNTYVKRNDYIKNTFWMKAILITSCVKSQLTEKYNLSLMVLLESKIRSKAEDEAGALYHRMTDLSKKSGRILSTSWSFRSSQICHGGVTSNWTIESLLWGPVIRGILDHYGR